MRRAAIIFAISIAAGAAQARSSSEAIAHPKGAPYYVQSSTHACASAESLMKPGAQCVTLDKSARVEWDGKTIDGFTPRYLGGNVARVASNGRALFIYANFLAPAPPTDPMRRQFTLTHDAIACQTPAPIGDAIEARAENDAAWFAASGCVMIPRGTSASRIMPAIAGAETEWRMRVRFPQDAAQELWMLAADFR